MKDLCVGTYSSKLKKGLPIAILLNISLKYLKFSGTIHSCIKNKCETKSVTYVAI